MAQAQAQTPRSSGSLTFKASGSLAQGPAGAVPALGLRTRASGPPGTPPASARGAAPRASVSAAPSQSLSARGAAPPRPHEEEERRRLGRERQKQKELQDKFQLLQSQRGRDEQLIEERRLRLARAREHRLDAALQALCSDNMLGPQASTVLLDHEAREELRQQALYNKWDAEVARRVEYHVGKFMNSAALPPPPGLDRCELRPGDDPLKRSLRDAHREERFHRYASAFLDQTVEAAASEEALERLAAARGTSRPMLPAEQWGRGAHGALRIAEDGTLRTTRKMGGETHRAPLDESDGVPVAGKTRTKFQKSLLGSLEGDARLGEAARYRTPQGASSGAPCQDHYGFETGVQAASAEFPLGKRVFPAGPPDVQRCMAAGAVSQNLLP